MKILNRRDTASAEDSERREELKIQEAGGVSNRGSGKSEEGASEMEKPRTGKTRRGSCEPQIISIDLLFSPN